LQVNELVRAAQLQQGASSSASGQTPKKQSTPQKQRDAVPATEGPDYPCWSKKQSQQQQALTPDPAKKGSSAKKGGKSPAKSPAGADDGVNNNGGPAQTPSVPKLPRMTPDNIAEAIIRIMQTFVLATMDAPTTKAGRRKSESILVFLSGLKPMNDVNKALRMRNIESKRAEVRTMPPLN
jgi:hypothetical protein